MSFNQNRQGGSWISKFWTMGADKRIKEIQTLKDDGTSADEVLAITRDLVIPISLIFSSLFCFIFYYNYLSEAYPLWVAVVGSGIIVALIELGKVFFGLRVGRYLYFDHPLGSVADTVLFSSMLAMAVLGFYWSVKNSTSGLHDLTQSTVQTNSYKALTFSPQVSDIDKQIADARSSQQKALGMKWRGNVTVEGQRLSRKSEETITKLQDQRMAMISQAQKQYDKGASMADDKTQKAASWTRLVGGLIEAVQLIMILVAVSCERKLADREESRRQRSNPSPASPTSNGRYNGQSNGNSPVPDNSNPFRASEPAYNNSVRLSEGLSDNNSRRTTDTDNDFINLRMKRLKGYDDLFKVGRNKPETVAGNMCVILNEIGTKFLDLGFQPSPETVAELEQYLSKTCFPVMEENGFYYKYKTELLTICHNIVTQAAAA